MASTRITPGARFDLYRETIINNPGDYAAPMSDDFHTNAVRAACPTNPTRTLAPAYGTQKTVDDWWAWRKQLHNEV